MKSHIAGLLAGLALTSYAQAKVLVFDFTATVASIAKDYGPQETGPGYMINGSLMTPGYTIKGQFSIDLATPKAWGGTSRAYYQGYGNTASFSVDQTGYAYTRGSPYGMSIDLYDSLPGSGADQFKAKIESQTHDPHSTLISTVESATFQFDQADGNMLTVRDSVGMPSLPRVLNFAGFDKATMVYNFADYLLTPNSASLNNSYLVTTNLTSLTLHSTSPVPEPSAYLMLTAGMLAIGAVRRRQRQGGRRGSPA